MKRLVYTWNVSLTWLWSRCWHFWSWSLLPYLVLSQGWARTLPSSCRLTQTRLWPRALPAWLLQRWTQLHLLWQVMSTSCPRNARAPVSLHQSEWFCFFFLKRFFKCLSSWILFSLEKTFVNNSCSLPFFLFLNIFYYIFCYTILNYNANVALTLLMFNVCV